MVVEAKSRILAGVLGILLGCFGVHNFYLGFKNKAIAQLLITVLTCGYGALITGIWGLIEGILILTGSVAADATGRPLKD
jgi:TM2 domain-containing membrane protein YozV